MNKLLQKEDEGVPSINQEEQLPKLDQEGLVTIHIEEQMDGEITTKKKRAEKIN